MKKARKTDIDLAEVVLLEVIGSLLDVRERHR